MCVHVLYIYIFGKIIYFIHFLLPFPFKWTHMMIYFYGFLILYSFNSMIFWFTCFFVGRYLYCFFFVRCVSADMLKEVKYLAVYHVVYFFLYSSLETHAYKNILYDALVCYYTIDLLFFLLWMNICRYVWHNICINIYVVQYNMGNILNKQIFSIFCLPCIWGGFKNGK